LERFNAEIPKLHTNKDKKKQIGHLLLEHCGFCGALLVLTQKETCEAAVQFTQPSITSEVSKFSAFF
jgi:hypothetical protein